MTLTSLQHGQGTAPDPHARRDDALRSRWAGVASVVGAIALSLTASAEAGLPEHIGRKLDRRLQKAVESASVSEQVIIQVVPGAGARLVQQLENRGIRPRPLNPGQDLLAARLDASDFEAVAARPDVLRISSDAVVEALGSTATIPDSLSHLIGTLGLTNAEWTGANVGVVVIDSGIAESRDFNWNWGFYDFTATDADGTPLPPRKTKPYDDYGHGTHVAGLIANNGSFGDGVYRGVAPQVTLYGFKVLDGEGRGLTSNVVRAIDFAIANRDALWIDVINLSLGHPILEPAASDPLVQAVERAVRAGIVVVASAGNIGRHHETGEIGYAGITSPGNAPSAITVWALDTRHTDSRTDDVIPGFSSRGPTWYDGFVKPDLVAPSAQLVASVSTSSTLYLSDPGLAIDTVGRAGEPTAYIRLSGTSMAAGVATGVVALMIQAHRETWGRGPGLLGVRAAPRLTPNIIKAILQVTALDVAGADALTQGAGALNGEGAVRVAAAIDTGVEEPVERLDTAPIDVTSQIAGESFTWAGRLVWGDQVLPADVIWQSDPAWTTTVVWGDRLVWGDRIVWGESLVWADPSLWATRIVWGEALLGFDTGSSILWGDRLVWGDHLVWGDRLVWGEIEELSGDTLIR